MSAIDDAVGMLAAAKAAAERLQELATHIKDQASMSGGPVEEAQGHITGVAGEGMGGLASEAYGLFGMVREEFDGIMREVEAAEQNAAAAKEKLDEWIALLESARQGGGY